MVKSKIIAAVIVAGGSGTRAGGELPKQYQMIAGKPLIRWTLDAFLSHPGIDHVLTVIGDDHAQLYADATVGVDNARHVLGGSSRQSSCYNGILGCAQFAPDVILIHDAARPFVSADLITTVINAVTSDTGAIPGIPVTDTLKRTTLGIVDGTVKRDQLWSVQTPQGFPFDLIKAAHEHARLESIDTMTDDAAVAEHANLKVRIVMGEAKNRKMTTSQDIENARIDLGGRQLRDRPDVRTGQGIDFHVFEKGNAVILGGVSIPHSKKLKGHSDADCILHALTDALLGALGEGDIGTHFPPSDAHWKNAASRIFVEHAMSLLSARDGIVGNVDITVLAEEPKINPHLAPMKQVIAGLCGIALDRVAIKATTTEKMGAIGRKEGIAAYALVTVRLPA
jgi:2-C-methyl-D-erythritol 4-phosphate cytidylyltransferase / 2-C-methyl-D-erythritol 2,4-cyclodiphosphate synthase